MHPGFPQDQNPRPVPGEKTPLAIGTVTEVPSIGQGGVGGDTDAEHFEIDLLKDTPIR